MFTYASNYNGIDDYHLKCKYCEKLMLYKGTTKTFDIIINVNVELQPK